MSECITENSRHRPFSSNFWDMMLSSFEERYTSEQCGVSIFSNKDGAGRFFQNSGTYLTNYIPLDSSRCHTSFWLKRIVSNPFLLS
jgi:hypothetical protein